MRSRGREFPTLVREGEEESTIRGSTEEERGGESLILGTGSDAREDEVKVGGTGAISGLGEAGFRVTGFPWAKITLRTKLEARAISASARVDPGRSRVDEVTPGEFAAWEGVWKSRMLLGRMLRSLGFGFPRELS